MHSRTKSCVTCVSVCNTDVESFVSVYLRDSVNVFKINFNFPTLSKVFFTFPFLNVTKSVEKGFSSILLLPQTFANPLPREEGIDGGWEVIANALAWFESRTSLQFRRVPGARPLLLMGGWMVGWQVSTKG